MFRHTTFGEGESTQSIDCQDCPEVLVPEDKLPVPVFPIPNLTGGILALVEQAILEHKIKYPNHIPVRKIIIGDNDRV